MSFFADKYAIHVIASYAVTAIVLGVMIWTSVTANARVRRELGELDQERRE